MTNTANPAPLGLFGFAVSLTMLSLFNVGWYGVNSFPLMMSTAFVFGGAAQFLAGLMEYPRGNTFNLVAFCSYGCFWFSFALYLIVLGGKGPLHYMGSWLIVWAVFSFALWLATLKMAGRVLKFMFLILWVAFLLLGLSHVLGEVEILHTIGGWIGFATAVTAFYLATAMVLNETHGRTVLPV